jgi:glycosyltransferase involved in cell wall biosynthesis
MNPSDIELSVVMPCLNEADTLEICVCKAQKALEEANIVGEIIVADNGSTDGSQEIAERLGARLVHVRNKGYGSALMGGIEAAAGKYILMGDADDSYDFLEIPKFIEKIREGHDLVQGCRLPSGGGTVLPGAMPFLHRWFGNPFFSHLSRRWFGVPIHDIYCGMRVFTKAMYERLDQRCTGMEFATEMMIKARRYRMRIAEVPITLHPDKRVSHPPHLKTFRDGWRTLRFFLMLSPRRLFLLPGLALVGVGLLGAALALPAVQIGTVILDAHTLLFSMLAILCGYQAILFAVLTRTFAMNENLMPLDVGLLRFFRWMNLERGVILGFFGIFLGGSFLINAVFIWQQTGFGRLDYAHTMRWVIPGATFVVLGFQTILFGFFTSILGMGRK